MKKFKINYLVRYFENGQGFTHSHRWVNVGMPSLTETKEHAFAYVIFAIGDSEVNIKSIEIGEIEEVTNEG